MMSQMGESCRAVARGPMDVFRARAYIDAETVRGLCCIIVVRASIPMYIYTKADLAPLLHACPSA
jgi:hypothetical protein